MSRWGRYGAAHAVIAHRGEVLMVQRSFLLSNHPGRWEPPGGARVAPSEPYLDAALRELLEETGYELTAVTVARTLEHREAQWTHQTFVIHTDEPPIRRSTTHTRDAITHQWFSPVQITGMTARGTVTPDLAREWPAVRHEIESW